MKGIIIRKENADCPFFQPVYWGSITDRLVICMGVNMKDLKKRIVSAIGIIMFLTVVSMIGRDEIEAFAIVSGDFKYSVNDDNETITISGYNGTNKEVIIPEKLDGYVVTALVNTFWGNDIVEKVILPDTIKSVRGYCFYMCDNLQEVVLNENLEIIGPETFFQCKKLRSINLPDSLTSIGTAAFYECTSLTEIIIPDKITEISESLFDSCSALVTVVLPENIETIGKNAFFLCTSLKNFEIPSGLKQLYTGAIRGCNLIEELYIPDNLELLERADLLPKNTRYYVKEGTEIYNTLASNKNIEIIAKIDISNLNINYTNAATYTGREIKPSVTVKKDSEKLEEKKDYTVLYNKNTNIGIADIIIKGNGKYTGCISYNFRIYPQKVLETVQTSYSATAVKLQWNITPGDVDGYQMYKYDSVSNTYKKVKSSSVNTIIDTKLASSTKYIYKVRAYKKVGNEILYGEFSDVTAAVTSPDKVSNFRWTESKSDRVSLKWDKSKDKITGYQIYKYNINKGKYLQLKTLSQTSRISWTNMYLKSNTEYKYMIRAYLTIDGKTYYGPLSDEVQTSTAVAAPKYKLVSDKKGEIKITWDKVQGATGYVLFYKTSADGEWKALTNSQYTGNSYTKKNLQSGKKYYFYVKAVKNYNGVKVKSSAYFKNKTAK